MVIKDFDSISNLINGLKNVCGEEEWYWGDNEIINNSLVIAYRNYEKEQDKKKSALPYLLMRYENYLRNKDAKTRGYKFTLEDIESLQIEHIAPQTETIEKSGEEKTSGYCDYDEEFNKSYINCIGNLLLIDGSHNGSIGNKPFDTKLKSYETSPLAQHREIKDFVLNKGMWDKDAINKRHKTLEDFVIKTWSF